uniref:Uncharacterized protein n=1 Tax=viral metagenome TaxID=1070528 RepID=A0A6C0CIB2_9ZZZZ
MGSRLSNTSWCWSPRSRCPDHKPPARRKSFDEIVEDEYEQKEAKEWMAWNKWRYSGGHDPDIGSIGEM